jgi:hypothetical protein
MAERTLELSRLERVRVWVFAGPVGRMWSFLLDLGTLLIALLAYLIDRARARLRRGQSAVA